MPHSKCSVNIQLIHACAMRVKRTFFSPTPMSLFLLWNRPTLMQASISPPLLLYSLLLPGKLARPQPQDWVWLVQWKPTPLVKDWVMNGYVTQPEPSKVWGEVCWGFQAATSISRKAPGSNWLSSLTAVVTHGCEVSHLASILRKKPTTVQGTDGGQGGERVLTNTTITVT